MKLDNLVFRYNTGVLLLVWLCALGCSQNVKVSGTITYSDDGEPVKSGNVFFASETEMGRAAIKDGKYSIGRINDGDGIPRGTYTISSDSVPIMTPRPSTMIGSDGSVVQVSNPIVEERSEFYYTKEPKTIEVKKSMTYDFQVERGVRAY